MEVSNLELTTKIRKLRDLLCGGLVERDVAIRLALIASLAGEHLLLLGPPGTAKSLIARRLRLVFSEATYFERLLTRFTVPEELFGPLSIKGLEEDRYERLTSAYLPTASIAFLDEIFKANSAILNALLTLLNEREFDNGTHRVKTPLIAVVGASNELPEGEELGALFDRFLLRLHVGPVSKDAFPILLGLRGHASPEIPEALKLTASDIAAAQSAAERVEVPPDVVAMLCDLRDWCTSEEIPVSDRRWRKIVTLLQVAAITNGRNKVSIWDCWLLQHCLWDTPEDRQKVYNWYASRVGASAAMNPTRLTRIVVSWEGKLKADQDSRSQMRDEQGRLLYKAPDGSLTADTRGRVQGMRGEAKLYLAPAQCWTRQYCQEQYRVRDRTDGGKGYTTNELDALYVGEYEQFQHWRNRPTYLADPSNWSMADIDLAASMEPTRHKGLYVDACLREIDELKLDVTKYKALLFQHMQSMEDEIRAHLWVTSDFIEPSFQTLQQTRHDIETLLVRVHKVRTGFELLPREVDGGGQPAPALKNSGAESSGTR
ncbi:AAA family ATPase [Sorangium sp. KYC3313]|uniref:AAA family ATPase n=1 Tax=Sorangium sp. KYC3313 TaxID=3449740 RepID=UPI003F8CEE1A